MCSPLKEHCRNCDKGYTFNNLGSIKSATFGERRIERLLIADRKCCQQCELAEGSKVTVFQEKVEEYNTFPNHNPCSDCGQFNHCGTQLRLGYTQGF